MDGCLKNIRRPNEENYNVERNECQTTGMWRVGRQKDFFPFRCMLMNHPQRHLSAFYEETGINIIFSSFHYTTNWIVAVIDQSYQSLGLHNNITLSTIQVKMMMMMMRWWRQISKIEVIHYKPNNNSEVLKKCHHVWRRTINVPYHGVLIRND